MEAFRGTLTFGAEELHRNTYPDGRIVAEMAVGDARFRVTDEAPEAGDLSPHALNGATIRVSLLVADPERLAERAIDWARPADRCADRPRG